MRTSRKYNTYHRINAGGIEEKQCRNCLEWLEMNKNNFGINNSNKDGFNHLCKKCQKKYNHEVYMKDRENRIAKSYQWEKEHPEQRKATRKKYYVTEQVKLKNKLVNQESRKRGVRLNWERSNPDKIKSYWQKRDVEKKHVISAKEWRACKTYFGNCCAYCGLHISNHYYTRLGVTKNGDLHKDHVNNEGKNDLSNCVPACRICNSSKHDASLQKWYNINNPVFSTEREEKIFNWLNEEYKKHIKISNI